ncbi:hypothetical protein [Arthrobacter glacialis]|uniref:Uncharacterized protein n=1 Tax=Arthrobacter glacialis TaxID=1664 RepID=A0A2S3ZV90_ARTGL|nr:hypothetical protein [Arthrobacter glacialis]POH72882.1 hypothetical protein CVS27_13515 [Arthrobacter glacialis]
MEFQQVAEDVADAAVGVIGTQENTAHRGEGFLYHRHHRRRTLMLPGLFQHPNTFPSLGAIAIDSIPAE